MGEGCTSHILPAKTSRAVDASSSAFSSKGEQSWVLARPQSLQSSVLSVLLQPSNASLNLESCLSCYWAIMKLFVC